MTTERAHRQTPTRRAVLSGLFAGAALAAASVALPSVAQATADGPDHYRVVDIPGHSHLNIRSRPSLRGRIIGEIAFDARGLSHTGRYRGRWVQVRHGRGTGWISTRFLAEDTPRNVTQYDVHGLRRGEYVALHRRPRHRARVLIDVPHDAIGLVACGACRDGWCPVLYEGIEGWVRQKHLIVARDSVYAQPNGRYRERVQDRYSRRPRVDVYELDRGELRAEQRPRRTFLRNLWPWNRRSY